MLTIHNADGSFADLQKALRARLNISKNEPLVIKQVDGDYTLDIETGASFVGPCFILLQLTRARAEEEYEAFCHFAKSVSQLHVSVNGGLMDQSKVTFLYHAVHVSHSWWNRGRQKSQLPSQYQASL